MKFFNFFIRILCLKYGEKTEREKNKFKFFGTSFGDIFCVPNPKLEEVWNHKSY